MSRKRTRRYRDERARKEQQNANEEHNGAAAVRDGNNDAGCGHDEPEPPNWVEKLTLIVLIGALGAALWAGYEGQRLAGDTEDATAKQSALTEESIVEANRAWVAPSAATADFVSPYFLLKVKFANFGRAPGFDLNKGGNSIAFVNLDSEGNPDGPVQPPDLQRCLSMPPDSSGIPVYPLPPDSEANPTVTFPLTIGPSDLLQSQLKAVLAGTGGIMIWGCITYVTFKKVHHLQFCYLQKKLPDKSIRASECKGGYYAD